MTSPAQLSLFAQESNAEFIARWHLLDSQSPHKIHLSIALCSGLMNHSLDWLKRHGCHHKAADLVVTGGMRVWRDAMHSARVSTPVPGAAA
ncbi:hypothetical protein D3C87_1818360 [compost metagenome]